MGFWDSIEGFEKIGANRKPGGEPSFLQKLGDFVHDEDNRKVIGYALEFMTDGYLNEDDLGQPEKDDQRKKKQPEDGTFEERLQRSLAELQQQASAPSAPAAPVIASPPPVDVPVAPIQPAMPRQALRTTMRGPGGFGRKGL